MFTSYIKNNPSMDPQVLRLAFKPKSTIISPTKEPLTDFHLFPKLLPELRILVWRYACASRTVEVRYDPTIDRCRSISPPPAILQATHESRTEALRIYTLSFATKTSDPRIYFNPYIDVLYLPRHRAMGYDETLRDFRTFLNTPELLDDVKAIAIDHVDVEVKRPWESYNKATLLRSFPNLDLVKLIIRENQRACGKVNEDFEFVEPRMEPEDILRIWVDFKQSFMREERTLKEIAMGLEREYIGWALPTVRVQTKVKKESV
ncbi:hypothetical protein sscle_10g075980 [Sclerotinia sclerotiorum 1980 UF-70]|uniref:2EXR domain-containing protein n=1 Tax=Sclerotinia sclerotiorum (strain ATCC 18683 / 1980 / Ss-1) TaxID=665079 RepID=A0A1D9QD42_SCLS1|nr:hypothetical protein sscle_10g075980 [Sclerotinia sclerotiorum 1980 UF-70]